MRKSLLLATVALVMALGAGCANYSTTPSYSATPPLQKNYSFDTSKSSYADNKVSASILPICSDYNGNFRGFKLVIENKTNNDLNLVWDDTYYLVNGEARGGFMFEGVVFSKRTEKKQDMLILPKTKRQIDIYPNEAVDFMKPAVIGSMVLPGGWTHEDLGTGEHGAYLKIKGKGIDKRIKLTLMSKNN